MVVTEWFIIPNKYFRGKPSEKRGEETNKPCQTNFSLAGCPCRAVADSALYCLL
jgi:hypothetical protein